MPAGTLGFLLLPADHPGTCLPEEALLMCQRNQVTVSWEVQLKAKHK